MAGLEGIIEVLTSPQMILFCALGVLVGIYIGALPGLTVTMAFALLISVTYTWDVMYALAAMVGIYVGGVYGGSRSAILINIPGAPNAVMTGLDGYPLAKKGEAGSAMGLATLVSCFGTFFGILVLAFSAPLMTKIALMFAPRDYFLLGLMGIFLLGSLGEGSLVKSIITGFIGIALGLIGVDNFTGTARLTFGIPKLMGGIHFVLIMIGLFGVSEVLIQIKEKVEPVKQKVGRLLPRLDQFTRNIFLSIRCAIIGTFIGALPGTGGDIAAVIAYDHAKRTVKNPSRPFGEGAYEGIIAPETANNASIGGAFIPTLTLGIPGDSATAILMGAMIIHGIRLGPTLMLKQPQFFWNVVGLLLIATVFLTIFGFTGIRMFCKIIEIPKSILLPIVVVISCVGSFAIQNRVTDVLWMVVFGFVGYFFKRFKFPVTPMVLGVILSPIIDSNLRRALAITHGFKGFLISLVTNPISLVLVLLILAMFIFNAGIPGYVKRFINQRKAKAVGDN